MGVNACAAMFNKGLMPLLIGVMGAVREAGEGSPRVVEPPIGEALSLREHHS